MYYRKVSGLAAATGMALALAGSAYADQGNSPNGPPGPAGNPNQPAAQPQANGPQGPAGNQQQARSNGSQGKSNSQGNSKSKGKSNSSKGKSNSSHGKSNSAPNSKSKSQSNSNHANPNPGTPRKGGREDRPAGKITICHATRSETNPYVEITISVNGLNGHGPAEDPHHHEGSWQDIIPAPAGGCPTTPQQSTERGKTQEKGTAGTTEQGTNQSTTLTAPAEVRPDMGVTAPAAGQVVLGAQAEGESNPAAETAPAGGVLGAQAEGGEAPAEAQAVREADEEGGSLPFTGLELIVVLAAAAAALMAGFALRRIAGSSQS